MSKHQNSVDHFATLRRSPRETLTFAVFALIATAATTLLAIAPAHATDSGGTQIGGVAQAPVR